MMTDRQKQTANHLYYVLRCTWCSRAKKQ